MHRIRWKLIAFGLLLLPLLWGQGQVSATVSQLGQTSVWVIQYNWTADAGGNVPVTPAGNLPAVQGYEITQVECAPGTLQPSATYGVAVLDSSGNDVLAGAANNVSGGQAQTFNTASSTPPLQGTLRLQVTKNTVAGAQGVVYVFLQKAGTLSKRQIRNMGIGGGGNVTADWLTLANAPFADARRYNFPPQAPGGSLIAGSNAITLQPCPQGVNGTDNGHSLYISGGTGTAEAVLITGGTCTSGAATGTITFTAANTHSGAWTIATATGGIAEAIYVAHAQGIVIVPCGSYNIYASITIPFSGMMINGYGNCSVLYPQSDGMKIFSATNVPGYLNLDFGGFQILSQGSVPILNTVTAISIVNDNFYRIHDLVCGDIYYCVYMDRGTAPLVQRIILQGNSTIWGGSTTDASNGYLGNAIIDTVQQYVSGRDGGLLMDNTRYYITLQRCTTCTIRGFKTSSLRNQTNGILLANDDEGCTIDDAAIVVPYNGIYLQRSTVGSTPATPSWTKISNIDIDRWSGTAIYNDNQGFFNKFTNLTITGASGIAFVSGMHFVADSRGSIVSHSTFQNIPGAHCIWLDTNVQYVTISSTYFDALSSVVGIVTSTGDDYLTITGNTFNLLSGMIPINNVPTAGFAHSSIQSNVNLPDLLTAKTLAQIGAPLAAGTSIYCTDCTMSAFCSNTPPGSGHMAVSNGSGWTCQ